MRDRDRSYLHSLGFNLPLVDKVPCAPQTIQPQESGTNAAGTGKIGAEAIVPDQTPVSHLRTQRTLIEYCCDADSMLGRKAPSDCEVIRITEEQDLTKREEMWKVYVTIRQGVPGKVLLWSSIPCTGGSQWNVLNLARWPSLFPKMQRHWEKFERLWSHFQELASMALRMGMLVAIE